MNTVEMTRKMIILLNEKLEQEEIRLSQAFAHMDFELLSDASRQLNLYAQRGYDLTTDGKTYARFRRKSRDDFFSLVQQEFQENGIDIVLPDTEYGGEAIYFKAFGERIGVLYGEHKVVVSEIGKDNVSHFHEMLDFQQERLQKREADIAEMDERKRVLLRLLDDPNLILSDEFADERQASFEMQTYGYRFKHQGFQRFVEKAFGKLIDRHIGYKMLSDIQKPETHKRFTARIQEIEYEREQALTEIQKLLERMEQLKAHEAKFEPVVTAFFTLLKKYNVPVEGKN